MVFSSSVFLFLFLPVVLLGYYVLFRKSRRWQNIFLTVASLGFYAWGEPVFVLAMLGSIIGNWLLGLLLEKSGDKARKAIVATSVALNIGMLFVFKYLSFFVNAIAGSEILNIALPIGISFFTFQAMSYVLDIWRGRGQKSPNDKQKSRYISAPD
jgi:alginate O-acetyltransferase complex protein AlgI